MLDHLVCSFPLLRSLNPTTLSLAVKGSFHELGPAAASPQTAAAAAAAPVPLIAKAERSFHRSMLVLPQAQPQGAQVSVCVRVCCVSFCVVCFEHRTGWFVPMCLRVGSSALSRLSQRALRMYSRSPS